MKSSCCTCAVFLSVITLVVPQAAAALPEIPASVAVEQAASTGQVVVETDLEPFFPLSQHSLLEASLRGAGKTTILRRQAVWPGLKKTRIGVDMIGLPAGEYEVALTLLDDKGKPIAASPVERFSWAGPAADSLAARSGLTVRNNLAIETLRAENIALGVPHERTFYQPFDGWVFIRSVVRTDGGGLQLRLAMPNGDVPLVRHAADGGPSVVEAMRYLPKGEHTLRIVPDHGATLKSLEVLAIPELMYASYPGDPHVPESGVYDWAFLERNALDNLNTIEVEADSAGSFVAPAAFGDRCRLRMREWTDQGKHWLFHGGVPGLKVNTSAELDQACQYWHDHVGMQNPLAAGIIVDEFPGASNDQPFEAWAKALDCVYEDPAVRGKRFHAYKFGSPWVEKPENKPFFDALVRHNGVIVEEWYPTSRPVENGVDADMVWYRNYFDTWQKAMLGVNRHLAVALGYMTCPAERLNVDPSVDFKVHMDMYMNWLANDPTFFGLFGLQWYKSAYAEEEYVRWGSRLFRHYAIEGKRNLLSNELGFEYHLRHVDNPNFERGTDGWTVTAAEEGSVDAKRFEGFGYLSGNTGEAEDKLGSAVLWMRRSAEKPNVAAQTIQNLRPGQFYSAKMISADYGNLTAGKSERKEPGIHLAVRGAERLEDRCFCRPIHCHPGRKLGAFDGQNPAWLHYHQVVFRATNETAQLQISDWTDPQTPGGPAGQESICNFIQVQPYYLAPSSGPAP